MIRADFKIGIVQQIPPHVKRSPCCGSGVTKHGKRSRGLEDPRFGAVRVDRYRCKSCQKTFSQRPQGVDRSPKSRRVRHFAVMLYCLGLSYDGVVAAIRAFGVNISKATVYNYVQRAGEKAKKLHCKSLGGKIRAVGMDLTVYKVKGKKVLTEIVCDAEKPANILTVEFVDAEDSHELEQVLRSVCPHEVPEILVSDDAPAYKELTDRLGIAHQVCQAHVKKNLVRKCREIQREVRGQDVASQQIREDCQWLLECVPRGRSLRESVLEVGRQIYQRYMEARPPGPGERANPAYRMKLLGTKLVEEGQRLFEFERWNRLTGGYLDATNNVSERAIGLCGKIRHRQRRGAKSKKATLKFIYLMAWLWAQKFLNHSRVDLTLLD